MTTVLFNMGKWAALLPVAAIITDRLTELRYRTKERNNDDGRLNEQWRPTCA